MIKVFLIIAVIIQTVATVYALRLVRATKYNAVWILFIIGFSLLSVERIVQVMVVNGGVGIPHDTFSWLGVVIEERTPAQREIIDNTTYVIDEAIRSLREISNNLSPQVLNDFGLARGIQNFISRSAALHSVRIRFTTNLRAERFDTDIEVILYRVVCELINNSLKHSGCSEINLSLSSGGDTLTLDYSDNGCGFNPAAVMDCGMGLSNIVSRVHSINGHCNVEGAKGKGMHAAIRVNVRGEASAAAGARRRTAARRRKRR